MTCSPLRSFVWRSFPFLLPPRARNRGVAVANPLHPVFCRWISFPPPSCAVPPAGCWHKESGLWGAGAAIFFSFFFLPCPFCSRLTAKQPGRLPWPAGIGAFRSRPPVLVDSQQDGASFGDSERTFSPPPPPPLGRIFKKWRYGGS